MTKKELYLKVFHDKSELVSPDGRREVFLEGSQTATAKKRYKQIIAVLAADYLGALISQCADEPESLSLGRLNEEQTVLLDALIGAMTSEKGRGLIVLMILQLCVKAIAPEQSIRLHKGGGAARDFSWQDGISMRTLDSKFISPTLRPAGLAQTQQERADDDALTGRELSLLESL